MKTKNNSKKNSILGIIVLVIIAIVIGMFISKNNDRANRDKETSVAKELTMGKYIWNLSNEYEIDVDLDGGTIEFSEDKYTNAYLGNGAWLEGKWDYENDNVVFKDIAFNTEWSNKAEDLDLKIYFKIHNKDQLVVTETIGESKEFHLIDMITGEMTDDTKELPITAFEKGNIFNLCK